ncbi:MAG: hypothetical protein II295_03260 [Akkermansia sp.]|nr:hypothetical protein [Akkermansia sp.]
MRFSRHLLHLLLLASMLAPMASGALNAGALRDLLKQEPPGITQMEQELSELRKDKEGAKQNRELISDLRRNISHSKAEFNKARTTALSMLKKTEQSRNINHRDEQGRTLLMLVAATGLDSATQMLLRENPALNIADKHNKVAYDYERSAGGNAITEHLKQMWQQAVPSMQCDRMEELMDCGADPNWQVAVELAETGEATQEAPIVLALLANNQTAFDLLMSFDASPETRTQDARKLVELVVEQQNDQAFITLLEKGCKTDTVFSDGRSMFEHLLAAGAEQCLNAWLRKATDTPGTASNLCLVARHGTLQAVQLIFSTHKEALNTEDSEGNLPLHEAARRGDPAIYQALLQAGATPHGTNMRGETPLMHAALSGSESMLATVLKDITPEHLQARDEAGHTAIHYARLAKDQAAEQALKTAGLSPQPND